MVQVRLTIAIIVRVFMTMIRRKEQINILKG